MTASLTRILACLAIGSAAGVTLGIIMGLSPFVRAMIQPVIAATYPVPSTAIVPLFLIIFGIGELSKILVIAISVFYIVLINTMTGVMQIDRIYLDVGKDIPEELEYGRLRLKTTVSISGARISLMIDVGFGDVLEPGGKELDYLSMLDFPVPRLRGYAREIVIAEKFQAMVGLGPNT